MDYIFDLLQGAGIAAALGIRPFLPVLLVGALAGGDVAVDFDGTDFSFLESPAFLVGIVALVAASDLIRRRFGEKALERGAPFTGFAVLTLALGGLEAAGSLADRGHEVAVGVGVGMVCASLGLAASRPIFARVRERLNAATAGYLPLYREGLALAAAGMSLAFPPLAVVVIGALVLLLVGGRRREGEKYAGLRILR